MDKLHGVDSLPVVLHRFSNGVEVVKCVVEFCNEVALLERSYSESLHRLLRSSSYTFHSNLLFQWLGNEPYEEIGSLKHCWQELGQELFKLADLHSEQAEAYQNTVRRPLTELLPHLEEARRALRVKMLQIKCNLELAYKKMNKERQKYVGLGECCERLQTQTRNVNTSGIAARLKLSRFERRLDSTEKQLYEQEQVYQISHGHYLQALKECEEEIQELYGRHHEREIERVNTLKESLLGFTKVLSNTAPAYLEGMQRIYFSVDKIDGASDIECFVNEHCDLQTAPQPPQLEKHSFVRDTPEEFSEREGDRRSPVGSMGEDQEGDSGDNPSVPLSSGTSDENVPSGSSFDGLAGSKPEKAAGLDRTQQEKLDANTGVVTTEKEIEDGKTATKDKPRRKWPLEGLWGGIKERLRPTESREEKAGKSVGGSVSSDAGETEGVSGGDEVAEEEEEGDARCRRYSELFAKGDVVTGVPSRKTETENERRKKVNEKRDESHNTSRHHSYYVPSIVHRMETSEEIVSSSTGSDHDTPMNSESSTQKKEKNGRIARSPMSPKPSPNPKPANLKILSGSYNRGRDGNTEGTQCGSKSSHPGSSALDEPPRPIQHKTEPQKTTHLRRTTQPDGTQQQRTTRKTTQQPRTPLSQGSIGSPNSTTTTHTPSLWTLPNLTVVSTHAESSSQQTSSAAKPPLSPRVDVRVDATLISDPNLRQLVMRLQQQALENDYYKLFGVDSRASSDDLARVRREKSRQLHPDHFANQPDRQERAQQQLMLINQVFQDVLKTTETRALYDQLCQFRLNYGHIPNQKQHGLEVAHCKLGSLHKQLKKCRAPLALLTELQTALDLVTACLDSGPSH